MTQLIDSLRSKGYVSQTELEEMRGCDGILPLSPYPTGRLVIRFLQEKADGATLTEILQHLRTQYHKDSRDLPNAVQSILESGTAMGFLERKGSCFVNWLAREQCCSHSRRRRRRRRRGGCSCRRRSRSRRRRRRRRCNQRRCNCRRRRRRRC
ncbi:uncharacterized protein LOC128683278 [Plodia interpunctella]|uniref:uncharacterized protein LOC128683278 n=1 Tax=Plodia interpunctella TaxID=58824 RepID=UPI0023682D56|nr:uncharacterized protein LOC128683278 [Plodia interpunctella]